MNLFQCNFSLQNSFVSNLSSSLAFLSSETINRKHVTNQSLELLPTQPCITPFWPRSDESLRARLGYQEKRFQKAIPARKLPPVFCVRESLFRTSFAIVIVVVAVGLGRRSQKEPLSSQRRDFPAHTFTTRRQLFAYIRAGWWWKDLLQCLAGDWRSCSTCQRRRGWSSPKKARLLLAGKCDVEKGFFLLCDSFYS